MNLSSILLLSDFFVAVCLNEFIMLCTPYIITPTLTMIIIIISHIEQVLTILSQTNRVALHSTYSHTGLIEDGEWDVVSAPWHDALEPGGRCLTVLTVNFSRI